MKGSIAYPLAGFRYPGAKLEAPFAPLGPSLAIRMQQNCKFRENFQIFGQRGDFIVFSRKR